MTPQLRGVWMLLVMLGAVLLLMRQVRQPAAVAFLGQLFGHPQSRQRVDAPAARGVAIKPVVAAAATGPAATVREAPPLDASQWGPVKDNAPFLAAEQPAWLALLQQARQLTLAELAEESLTEVAYAQLVNQPDVYRGRAVRVSGRVLRESTKPAPANEFGITRLHQLILAPRGGGQWPIAVYALDLPTNFPRGDGIGEDVTIDGLFFKNWSFPYDGGIGLAPVLVTPTLAWRAPTDRIGAAALNQSGAAPPATTQVVVGALLAGGAAVAFVAWAAMQTRRSRHISALPPDLGDLESDP